MTLYICAFYPKKAAALNGTLPTATSLEAKNMKLAEMKAVMALEEAYPETSDKYLKPKISEIAGSTDQPPRNTFDDEWLIHNKWNESTRDFEPMSLSELSLQSTCSSSAIKLKAAKSMTLPDLPIDERICYIILYGVAEEAVDPERRTRAASMVTDENAPLKIRVILNGLRHLATVKAMFITPLAELIDALRTSLTADDNVMDAINFAEKWISDRPIEDLVINSSEVTLLEVLDDIETAIKGGMISAYPQRFNNKSTPYYPIEDEDFDKLKIWKQASIIVPNDIESSAQTSGKPSVTYEFIVKRATELFGPVGIGWGYEIINERMLDGLPITEHISDDDGPTAHTLLRDADGMLIFELNHLHLVKVWYIFEGVRAEVSAYGSAAYLSSSKEWITTSTGAHQESLLNAIHNGFALLGFGADVGLHNIAPPREVDEQTFFEPIRA
ncbi:hypothetical protein SC206_18225 [Rouxiella sp. T17]|uniref:hypothetical protein n=1 Tax=Rouxiella sp. T17 TaxID=3085684 RepID=UPI002FC9350A